MPDVFPQDQRPDSGKVLVEHGAVPANEGIRQVEDADFLGKVLVDQQVGVVGHLPTVVRAAAHILKVLVPVVKIDDCGRNRHGNDDQCRPPEHRGEDDNVGDQRNNRADHGEGGGQDLDGAVSRFAVGIFQLFIESGEVKGLQIQLLCLVHDLQLDSPHDQFARNAADRVLEYVDKACQNVVAEQKDQQKKHGTAQEIAESAGEIAVAALHFVEHVLGDFRADDGRDALQQGNCQHGEQNPRSGFPDQPENVCQTGKEPAAQLLQVTWDIGNTFGGRDFFVAEIHSGWRSGRHRVIPFR